MNHEQFAQFWSQLRAPLKATWSDITDQDLADIQGNLTQFTTVLEKRYGATRKAEVATWVNRRYAHWSGNYVGYRDPVPAAS